MNMNEIKEMPPVELLAKGRELRAELFNLNLQKSIGTLEKPHRIGELRKDIALSLIHISEPTRPY